MTDNKNPLTTRKLGNIESFSLGFRTILLITGCLPLGLKTPSADKYRILDGCPGIEVYILDEVDSMTGIPEGVIYAFRPYSFSAKMARRL
jgi:hypothetical protein